MAGLPRGSHAVVVLAVFLFLATFWLTASRQATSRVLSLSFLHEIPAALPMDRRWPRVYVYDLPEELLLSSTEAELTSWDALEWYLWRAFQSYTHRVHDPNLADFFYIPHITALTFHRSHYNKTVSGDHLLRITHYVADKYPFLARSGGVDHFTAFGHDSFHNIMLADQFLLLPPPFVHNTFFIVHQGDDNFFKPPGSQLFDVRRDIVVVPPTRDVKEQWEVSGIVRLPWRERKWLAVFRGAVNKAHLAYSNGLRQALATLLENDPDILWGEHSDSYVEDIAHARFCLYLKGWHVWSERLGTILTAGCIPVIISDHYALPFWQQLDWTQFSIRIPQADALRPGFIKDVLRNVSEARALELEARVEALRHSLSYNLPTQPGDIFTRILRELADRKTEFPPISGRLRWGRL